MAKAQNYRPPEFGTLTLHLTVPGGAAKYIDFLTRAFGAQERGRSVTPDCRLMHATIAIGDSVLMLNDDFRDWGAPPVAEGRWPVVLNLYVPDADKALEQALAAGCELKFPLQDQFWGDRYCQVQDPFGFTWALATHIEDLTPEELQERQKAMFSGTHP